MVYINTVVTLECGRVPVSESCGKLMIGNDHEKDLFSLIETLEDTMESQCVMNITVRDISR